MNSRSLAPLETDDLGPWIHRVWVIDATAKVVDHDLDGKAIGRCRSEAVRPIRVGAAEVGHRASSGSSHPIGVLDGRMDRFGIFARAVFGEEIA